MTTPILSSQTSPSRNPLSNPIAEVCPESGPIAGEVSINRILESAVVLSWKEIMPQHAGLIHIEYETKADRSPAYLKIWSSVTRGYWDLVCEYWVDPGPWNTAGLSFGKDYGSPMLVHMLPAVMRNQDLFSASAEAGKKVVLQVYPPDAETTSKAELLRTRYLSWIQGDLKNAQPDNAGWENEGGKRIA